MERKEGTSDVKSSKVNRTDDNERWQIDPLADYKKSSKKVKDSKQEEDDKKGSMGFDEWSVSWP
ncbi:hypothetical protein [Pedobacter suwonensis]|uniref:hypothetical protein n=1 Tax=Pedobacter suwonensis TaxID=332999 RepID=UPI001065B6C7|nr:hypothetical protein [Pedobacter suwonensis]